MAQNILGAVENIPVYTTARQSARLFFVDHLRAVLMIFVVLHHVAMVYGASAPFYYVEPPFADPQGFQQLLIFALTNQAWHMGAFFLLAGYFTPRSFDRKGTATFVKDRLIRLGIPLLVYLFFLNPIAELSIYLMPVELTGLTHAPTWAAYPKMIGLGPLWFVVMLLLFDFVYVVWRNLTGNQSPAQNSSLVRLTYTRIAVFMLALAVITYLFRMLVPLGRPVNLFVDFLSFPSIAYLPQYISFFVLGIVAYRNDWLRTLPGMVGIVGFIVAAIVTVVLFPLAFSGQLFSLEITPALDNAMGNGHWQSAVYALWDSAFSVGMFLGSIVLFRRLLNVQRWLGTFLSQQSYTVYIIHIPLVVYLAYLLRAIELNAVPKTVVASLVIVPICFIVAYLVRRIPFASRVL